MNIFASSMSPVISARALDDKRVIKMILESAQMLNTAAIAGSNTDICGYKPTHRNHPCTISVTGSKQNYIWLANHMAALCTEYTKRYGKVHKCESFLNKFYDYANSLEGSMNSVNFANCTANHKHIDNVYEAYRQCLLEKWRNDKRVPTWYGKKAGSKLSPASKDCLTWVDNPNINKGN